MTNRDTTTLTRDSHAPSISKKLRKGIIGLGVITMLSAICTVLGYSFIQSIQTRTFSDQALQLKNTDQIAELSRRFTLFTQRLNAARDRSQLDQLKEENQTFIVQLKQALDSLSANTTDQRASQLRRALGDLLSQSSQILNKAIEQTHQSFVLDSKLQNELSSIINQKEKIRIFIENESLQTNIKFYTQAKKEYLNSGSIDLMTTAFEYQQRLAELTLDINRQFELLIDLKNTNSTQTASELAQVFQLSVRDFATTSAEINNNSELSAFSRFLYDAIKNENSAFSIKNKLLISTKTRKQSLDELKSLNKKIQDINNHYRQYVLEKNLLSTKDLQNKTALTSLIVIFVLVISLIIYTYIFRQFIFNKIITPLLNITRITNKLSHGDLSVTIPKYHEVELQNMANALDTFRRNARLLEQSNEELRKANADIEDFAYAASHDLKSPLRGISNLVMFLRQDLEGKLDPESQENLEEISNRTRRLEALLSDLLRYARDDSQLANIEHINIKTLLNDTFALLNTNDTFKLRIESDIDTLFTISMPLQQVLHNLIDNAIKHHDQYQGTIGIEIRESNSRYHFAVEDDGSGIPEEYHERIFKLFQTLKPRDQTEGSGLGLSLVAKIVRGFNGEVGIISNPSIKKGACFTFDWPKFNTQATNDITQG